MCVKKLTVRVFATILGFISISCQGDTPPENLSKPNIVVILADDAGYADFGFQNSQDMKTPNIDDFAKLGVRYSNAYVTTPFCSPSRAGLLTGRYPQRFGYEFNITHEPMPGVDPSYTGLAVEEKTLADLLKAQNYATAAIGKWHLGDLPKYHPNNRGFDYFYGMTGGGSHYHPSQVKLGKGFMRNQQDVLPRKYLTDDFTDEAIGFIERNEKTPFFLYLAYNAVHTPMDVTEHDMNLFPHIKDKQKKRLAAMTWALDRGVGRVLRTLESKGLMNNTLVIFTNDNGGDRIGIGADNSPLRGTKGTLLEGGVRVPFVAYFKGKLEGGIESDKVISLMDIVPTALELSDTKIPKSIDGVSLLEQSSSERALYWRYDVVGAMREGKWKLLRFPDRAPQLYDLDNDIAEKNDLAVRHKSVVDSMLKSIFKWEAGLTHARWNTGTYWTQEDVRRYDEQHVKQQNHKHRSKL